MFDEGATDDGVRADDGVQVDDGEGWRRVRTAMREDRNER